MLSNNFGRNLTPEQLVQAFTSVNHEAPDANVKLQETVLEAIKSGLSHVQSGSKAELQAVAEAIAKAIQQDRNTYRDNMGALIKGVESEFNRIKGEINSVRKEVEKTDQKASSIKMPKIPEVKHQNWQPVIDKVESALMQRVDNHIGQAVSIMARSLANVESLVKQMSEDETEESPKITGMTITEDRGVYEVEFKYG